MIRKKKANLKLSKRTMRIAKKKAKSIKKIGKILTLRISKAKKLFTSQV